MTNLSVFTFESHEVRFVGTPEKPEWVANDVCKVLGISDTSQAVSKLDNDEKLMRTLHASGQNREMLTITEAGLYRLIFTSRKPIAKRFQRWVFHEVLPSIRATGSYSVQLQHQLVLPGNIESEFTALTNKCTDIERQIKEYEEVIARLKATHRELDRKCLDLAKQFVEEHSRLGEMYVLAKQQIKKTVVNPWQA